LFDFIKETKEIYRNNSIHDGKKFKLKIKGFSVDAPAKSFMLHSAYKGHEGYSICTKCEVEGEYISLMKMFDYEVIKILKTVVIMNIILAELTYYQFLT